MLRADDLVPPVFVVGGARVSVQPERMVVRRAAAAVGSLVLR